MKKRILLCFFFQLALFAPFLLIAQNVGIGTTSPLARLHVADSAVVFTRNTTSFDPDANPPVQGSGIRMMWFPERAAFRVGTLTGNNWDRDNIGFTSFASGNNSKASGLISTAMGNFTTASGLASTAMGGSTTASGNTSTAMGTNTIASGISSVAMNNGTTASGLASTAMGYETKAKAFAGVTVGYYNDDLDNPSPITPAATDRMFQIGNGDYNARTNALTVLRNGNTGIGHTDPAYRLDISGRMRIRSGGDLNNSAGIFLNNTDNSAIPAFMGMQSNENIGFYGNTSGWSFVMNTTTGKTGIGTTTPASTLEVNGFTKLGTDAPAVKVKKLTGTTASAQGLNVHIPHGVTLSKIIAVTVLVESLSNNYTPPAFNLFTGYEYNFDLLDGDIWIFNVDGNSGNILSKPFKVLITYEE